MKSGVDAPSWLLGMLSLVFLAGLAAELSARPLKLDEAPLPPPDDKKLPSFGRFEASSVDELAARPLFVATRRPPPPVAAPVTEKPLAPPPPPAPLPETQLTLLGIIDAPTAKLAVIRRSGGVTVRVAEGAQLDRWQVDRILRDRVVLRAGTSEQELHFPVLAQHRPPASSTGPRNVPILSPP